jgi:hypothetical protein
MKQFGIAMVLALGVVLAGCGGGTSNSSLPTITGNWTATLTNTDMTPAFTFTTLLTQGSTTLVTGGNLTFTSTACFTSGGTETGSFIVGANFNGNLTGAFQLTIVSGTPPGNTLTLKGTVNDNTIAGTWVLSGGCRGAGTFTLTKM